MPEAWTGDLVKKMHMHQISRAELAKSMDVSPQWISAILNGHRTAKNAELRFNEAVDDIISRED